MQEFAFKPDGSSADAKPLLSAVTITGNRTVLAIRSNYQEFVVCHVAENGECQFGRYFESFEAALDCFKQRAGLDYVLKQHFCSF